MRNLWIFFLRYYSFFLFLVLEGIAFTLIINNNSYQGASYFNSANTVSAELYEYVSNAKSFLYLKSVNDSLAKENALLKNQLKAEYYSNVSIRGTKRDSLRFQQYHYVQATVVNNNINKRNNYITIDRGYLHGIQKGMGVISGDGVVGVVKDVSAHYSTIMSFLHKDAKISAQLNNTKDFGSLVWEGYNPRMATLKDVPTHVKVKLGDSVTTTGYSRYPQNTMIGRVAHVEQRSGDNFHNIDVVLSNNFSTLRYVYVVIDDLAKEKESLESKLEEAK
jgi:rod shape-determining protein MreC